MAKQDSPVIREGKTTNGVTIYLHASGEVSNRMNYYGRVKLHEWNRERIFEDLFNLHSDEILGFLRKNKNRIKLS